MRDDIDARIGRNLRAIRMEADLDIDALACRTGLQPAVLALYEAGRLHVPVDVLTRLAAALDRPLADLFAWPPLGRRRLRAYIRATGRRCRPRR